jgi:hypothetical protein
VTRKLSGVFGSFRAPLQQYQAAVDKHNLVVQLTINHNDLNALETILWKQRKFGLVLLRFLVDKAITEGNCPM